MENARWQVTAITLGYRKLTDNGLKNNGLIFTGYPVVGRQGKMLTSGSCLYSPIVRIDSLCAWDPGVKGFFFMSQLQYLVLQSLETSSEMLKD